MIKLFIKTALPLIIALLMSCETQLDPEKVSDFLKVPSLTVENNRTVQSDSGKIQLILSFPLLEQYDNVEKPYWEFRKGIRVDFYDGDTVPQGSVTSKYARYEESNELWELKDSVVVVNSKDERLETELLYWDQKKDFIYTDRFVKMTSAENITQGFGFESDSHMKRRVIKKVSAVITIDEEE
jgi:LPS export ABC transporter protein LptC